MVTFRTPLASWILTFAAAIHALPAQAQPDAPVPRPVEPARNEPGGGGDGLARIRAAYLAAPTTERLRVTVRRGDSLPRRSLLLVRLEPNDDSTALARIVIRAGRLLIQATRGEVRARLDTPESPVFTATTDRAAISDTLIDLLPPLPIASLDIAEHDEPPIRLTQYATGMAIAIREAPAPARDSTIEGTCDGGFFKLQFDLATGRIRRLEITRPDPAQPARTTVITIEHTASTADLASVEVSETGRAAAQSMAELGAGLPQSAIGTEVIAAPGSAAADALDLAAASTTGRTRPVIVLLGAPGGAATDGPFPAETLAALAKDFSTVQPESPRDPAPLQVDAGFVMLWQAIDAAEDARIARALESVAARVHLAGLSGVEAELARIAPTSRAAFVVLASDRSILSVHPLERLSRDPEQQLAELAMALLDASYADSLSKEGP